MLRAIEDAVSGLTADRVDEYVGYLRIMMLIREFEDRTGEMYTRAKIGGYCHLNSGEEATVVGAITALRDEDYIFSAYREHGHALARGIPARAIMAELFGKETGTSKGRGGSMHIYDASKRFMGGYGIVGGHLPLAVGAAFAIDYRGSDDAVLCLFGEGATNIGAFHESLNIAKVWRLPVVWLCVNNQYAMGSPEAADSATAELHHKARGYDMEGVKVDGMDLLAVQSAIRDAVRKARYDRMPSLVEAETYRYRGHSMADAGTYRSPEEIDFWKARDPIILWSNRLRENGLIDDARIDQLRSEVEAEVRDAVEFADKSPDPLLDELHLYTYASDEA
jgi:pyruvate dehydrogenase E1 component alpha subunit